MTEQQPPMTEQNVIDEFQAHFEALLERIHEAVGEQWFTEYSLSSKLGVSREEAKDLIKLFFNAGLLVREHNRPKYHLSITLFQDYDKVMSVVKEKIDEHYASIAAAKAAELLILSAAQHAMSLDKAEQPKEQEDGKEEVPVSE